MPADKTDIALAALASLRLGFKVSCHNSTNQGICACFGLADSVLVNRYWDAFTLCQIVDVSRPHVDAFPASGRRVNGELKFIIRARIGSGLVIHQSHRTDDATLSIQDHVGATSNQTGIEMQFKGAFSLPDTDEIITVLAQVALNQFVGRLIQFVKSRLVRKGKVELVLKDLVYCILWDWQFILGLHMIRNSPKDVMNCLAIPQFCD